MPEQETVTVTGEDFVGQSLARQQEILTSLSPVDRKLMRVAARRERIADAIARINKRLGAGGLTSESVKALKGRLAEYAVSLENLAKFRQEEIPSGKPLGVEIDVPLGGR